MLLKRVSAWPSSGFVFASLPRVAVAVAALLCRFGFLEAMHMFRNLTRHMHARWLGDTENHNGDA